ncbi:MAG TPA: hypothetical protein VGC59_04040 [Solirubrobacteraceae bacterium]
MAVEHDALAVKVLRDLRALGVSVAIETFPRHSPAAPRDGDLGLQTYVSVPLVNVEGHI